MVVAAVVVTAVVVAAVIVAAVVVAATVVAAMVVAADVVVTAVVVAAVVLVDLELEQDLDVAVVQLGQGKPLVPLAVCISYLVYPVCNIQQ